MASDATEMIATVDSARITAGAVAYEKPSERLEFVLKPYIVQRMRAEDRRGYAAEVARAVGVSRTHIHDVMKKGKGISEDFVHGIARFWKITPEELGRQAEKGLAERQRADNDEDTSPKARLMRLIEEEVRERGSITSEQLSRAMSLAAFGGKITRADVQRAFDRTDESEAVDAELEREHTASRGKPKRRR